MFQNQFKKIKNNDFLCHDFLMILLLFISVPLITIFIVFYCQQFEKFGFLAQKRLIENPLSSFILTPFLFWLSAFICRRFSQNASGSSIGHVKDAINQLQNSSDSFSKIKRFLSLRVLVVNFCSSLICSFGGGTLGKEGPSIQMAASCFAEIGAKTKNIFTKIKSESWAFIGIAVGLTAAFSTPIAGFIYVLEKLIKVKIKYFRSDIIWSITAILITILTLGKIDPFFGKISLHSKPQEAFIFVIITILFCVFIAEIFNKISHYLYHKFIAVKSNLWHFIPLFCGLAVVSISFYCGINSITSGLLTTKYLLADSSHAISYQEVFGRILNTSITFFSGSAGGLVAPAISIGNGIGFVVSNFVTNIDRNIFLLVGMVSFLTIILVEPFAAAAIIFELTGRDISLITLLLSSALFSVLIKSLISKTRLPNMIRRVYSSGSILKKILNK